MKKLTFFICSLSSGGAEHQLSILANFLCELGYIVEIVTFADKEDHYVINSAIKRIRLDRKKKISLLINIWKYFFQVKTDCIISFGQRENFLCLIPALFRRVKVVAGERNYTKGSSNRIEQLLFQYLYKRADYIVPNSYSQKSYICEYYPLYKNKTIVITNYTDLYSYKYSLPPNNYIRKIGVFCRYEKQKNCINFIKAVAEVKKYVKKPFIIEWYGSQQFANEQLQTYFNTIKKLIQELHLDNTVILNPATKKVAELLPNYDAICLPSLKEGFSNSISEAICCGKPMLVSDVSDNSVMVYDSYNGFLFDPLIIESMKSAIIKFLNLDNNDISEMGKRSRQIAETLFDKNLFIGKYIELIES